MPDTTELLSHYYLKLGGKQPRAELLTNVTEIVVESSLHLPDVATITLLDPETTWADSPDLAPGKEITISARGQRKEHPLFDGEIVELELAWEQGLQKVHVRAFDRMHRLARGRTVRSFQNMTDGDIVRKIAQEVGLQVRVGPTNQVNDYVLQANQSNLDFLRGRAAALGYLLFVHEKTLHCEPPGNQGQTVQLHWGRELNEFRPRMSTLGQVAQVTARGWDPAERREIVGDSKESQVIPQVGAGKSGGKLAEEAFHMPNVKHLVTDRPLRAQPVAEKLAQAVADRHAGHFIEAEGASRGNPGLIAGAQVSIANIGQRFSGQYFVTGAVHSFRPGEYTTRFSVSGLQPATLIQLLAPEDDVAIPSGLVIGIVTDNKDPDGLGRVKVKYPWLSSEHASYWARVVAIGAGNERGIEFVPEVNDEVLVGFELGDINYPYVLGGLWNGKDKPPKPSNQLLSGGKVKQRIIRSRAGHIITLDDSDGGGGVTIEDKNGNKIALDSANNALTIEVKGDATVKSRGNLSLDAQGNLSLQAKGKLDIKGMGVSVDGGVANVDVKGTMINLN